MNITEEALVYSPSGVTGASPFGLPSPEDLRTVPVIAILTLLFILIMLAISTGNTIVIIAVATHRSLKNQQSNLFILNLAITDLMVVFGVMIWTSISLSMNYGTDEMKPWALSEVICMIQCAMNYCLIVVSMMTLGFISVDRLIHILYPLRYLEIVTPTRIRITIVWTWIQGLTIGFIPVGLHWIHYDYCETVCAIDWSSKGADIFVIVAFITCFLTPALTMLFCYIFIFRRSMIFTTEVRRSMSLGQSSESKSSKGSQSGSRFSIFKKSSSNNKPSKVLEPSGNTSERERIRRHNKTVKESTIIKSLLVVVMVFFVCMTPFSVTKLIKVLNGFVPCWVNTLATFVQVLASAFNPLIYGIFRKEYRKAFKYQYYKLCNRMAHRFDSTERSETSIKNSYYENSRHQSKKGIYRPRHTSNLDSNPVSGQHQEGSVKQMSSTSTPEESSSSQH